MNIKKLLVLTISFLLLPAAICAQETAEPMIEEPIIQINTLDDFEKALNQSNQQLEQFSPRTLAEAQEMVSAFNEDAPAAQTDIPRGQAAEKLWQFVVFLGAHDDNSRNRHVNRAIVRAMKRGHIARVAVLEEPLPETQSTENAETAPLYVYTLQNGQVHKDTYALSRYLSVIDTVSALFSYIGNSPFKDTYLGMMINMHGTNKGMYLYNLYAHGGRISAERTLDLAKKQGLFIDVLDLESCHMGSMETLLALIKKENVHYALVSPNLGTSIDLPHGLVREAAFSPEYVAKYTLLADHSESMEYGSTYYTYSKALWNIPALKKPISHWISEWNQTEGFFNELVRSQVVEEKFVSLLRVARKIEKVIGTSGDFSNRENFEKANKELLTVISPKSMPQYCYSKKLDRFYSISSYERHLPPLNSDCIASVNVDVGNLVWREYKPPVYPHIIF